MKHEPAPLWTIALLTIALASPALAVDGVLEINQACADSGCFSGDGAGFPVIISAAGSYRLTSNLVVPNENTDGIYVAASSVSIDLNGFEIIGAACVGASNSTCTPASGTGSGIKRGASFNRSISVKNGSITGMGYHGIWLGEQAEVTNARVRWNRLSGIYADSDSTVSGNKAYQNGDDGIHTNFGSTVSGNTVYVNGGDGIYASFGSTVSGNTAHSNSGYGIYASGGSTVSGNTAHGNGDDGIYVGYGSTVSDNTAYGNGDDGIYVGSGSTVSGNTVRGNTGYGLRFTGTDAAYSENVISGNTAGTITGSAVQLGQNACNGNTTCP